MDSKLTFSKVAVFESFESLEPTKEASAFVEYTLLPYTEQLFGDTFTQPHFCFRNAQYIVYAFEHMKRHHPRATTAFEVKYVEGLFKRSGYNSKIRHAFVLVEGFLLDTTLVQKVYLNTSSYLKNKVWGLFPSSMFYTGACVQNAKVVYNLDSFFSTRPLLF